MKVNSINILNNVFLIRLVLIFTFLLSPILVFVFWKQNRHRIYKFLNSPI